MVKSVLALGLWAAAAAAGPADAGAVTLPPTPSSPVPADEACRPLPAPLPGMSFRPGEELTYDVDALGAKAATMVMRVLPRRGATLPIEVTARTNSFFSKIRNVRGTVVASLDPRTMRPVRYVEDTIENEWHRQVQVDFPGDRTAQLRWDINGNKGQRALPYAGDGLDVAGAAFVMRQLPFKERQAICFDVYALRTMWRVWGLVLPRETVSLPLGEFPALHLAGESVRLDWRDGPRRKIHIWLSDDARRLPLAALGTIDLGGVRATLIRAQRPGEPVLEAGPPGSLEW